jgi:hypothetical protein
MPAKHTVTVETTVEDWIWETSRIVLRMEVSFRAIIKISLRRTHRDKPLLLYAG